MPLDGSESVVRSILYPRILENEHVSPSALVSPFLPKEVASGIGGYGLSVGRLSMLPDDAAVHAFGCQVADAANKWFERQKGHPPVRGIDSVHYIGSYDLQVEAVISIQSDVFAIAVEPCPENGLEAHCDIELTPKTPPANPSQEKRQRRQTVDIVAELYLLLRNPRRFFRESDADLRDKIEAIELPDFSAEPASPAAA